MTVQRHPCSHSDVTVCYFSPSMHNSTGRQLSWQLSCLAFKVYYVLVACFWGLITGSIIAVKSFLFLSFPVYNLEPRDRGRSDSTFYSEPIKINCPLQVLPSHFCVASWNERPLFGKLEHSPPVWICFSLMNAGLYNLCEQSVRFLSARYIPDVI